MYLGVRKVLHGISLGELEAQIMDIIWDMEPPVTTTQVFKIMYAKRELSYTTIMLTMTKLTRKGILTRERVGEKQKDPFIYCPKCSREEVVFAILNEIAEQLMHMPLQEAVVVLYEKLKP